MATLDLKIDNMHCGACVRRVSQTLNSLPDTHANSVAIGAATVTTATDNNGILQALTAAGYPAHILETRP